MRPALRELLSIQFFEFSSARGYTTAGSFLRFLLDTYGAPKLRALYHSGGDFAGVYDKSLGELETQWRQMIDQIDLPKAVIEGTRERFRGGSVFSRPCPHAIAARRDAALGELSHGDRDKALALLRDVCAEAPDEPRNRIDLAGVLIVGDPFQRAQAHAIWTAIADDDGVTTTLRAEVLDKLARTLTTDRDKLALIERARALPLDGNERRQLDAEAFSLAHAGPAGDALRSYFFAAIGAEPIRDAQRAADAEPTLGFAHYLLGLQLSNAGDWPGAASEIDEALARGLPGSNFVRFAARRLAIAAYRTADRAKLDRAIAALRGPDTNAVDHLLATDWQQRLDSDLHTR
jgi:tetratricopeptide (TPR) repeat protein